MEDLGGLDWRIGQEFRILTVSLDPGETPERAAGTKEKYLDLYGNEVPSTGWRFLTGEEKNISAHSSPARADIY